MKVQTLLDQAAQCKTVSDAQDLCLAMQAAFANCSALSHLGVYNPDYTMEADGPYAQFELNREISEYYVTAIKPGIRSGEFFVDVRTTHMKDGRGLLSRSWANVDGLDEEVIDVLSDEAVEDVAQRAKEMALLHQSLLIERAGVPEAAAREAALASW